MTQEFHISVTPVGNDRFLARTERVAQGVPLAEEQVILPIEQWLTQARRLMNDPLIGLLQETSVASSAIAPRNLLEFGQQLYTALLQESLRESWVIAQGVAQNRGEILRLRLGLKGLQLPRLPWEVMQNGDLSEQFVHPAGAGLAARPLATRTDVVFSRYQATSAMGTVAPIVETQEPLRILMAIAAPTDQQRLSLHQEALQLQQELSPKPGLNGRATERDIHLTILEQPGRERLTQAVEQGRYQVFHYAGHSDLGEAGGALYLVNEKTGLTEPLSGDDLAGLLANNGVYMAIFNSCRGTHTAASGATGDRNLAEALVDWGIPAVLAMAETIPDDVALTLSRLFYRNLKQGYPIDLSLSRARQGLISAYGSQQLYWALPILYMNPEFDGYLIGGDRSEGVENLLLSLPAYDIPVDWAGDEDLIAVVADTIPANLPSQLSLDSQIETDHTFTHWVNAEGDASNQEDLLDEEDVSVVASLIQQLSHPYPNSLPLEELEEFDIDFEDDDARLGSTAASSQLVWEAASALRSDGEMGAIAAEPYREESDSAGVATLERPLRPIFPSAVGERIQPNHNWRSLWLAGLVGAGVITVLGGVLLTGLRLWNGNIGQPPSTTPTTQLADRLEVPADWTVPETARVAGIAIAYFKQNDLTIGQRAVEELLNRGALSEAQAALDAVPSPHLSDAGISFLRGRLAWEWLKRQNPDYSYDDVRRYWLVAAQQQPNAPYQTALGFAYYAEGRSQEAIQAFCQAIALVQPSPPTSVPTDAQLPGCLSDQLPTDRQGLNAYAGIALVMAQLAIEQPDLLAQAINIQGTVLTTDPTHYQTQALGNDWLWTPTAIQEWDRLMQLKP